VLRRLLCFQARGFPGHSDPVGSSALEPARYLRVDPPSWREKEATVGNLLYWAVIFLVVALISAALGFTGVAGTAMEGARLLFWVAIILFIVSIVAGVFRGRRRL
jgi:uncharacterized membrane protein YtjA (UPF0391 family)